MAHRKRRAAARTSWDGVADWYDKWVERGGPGAHRRIAIPALLDLLEPMKGERVLDVGCGQGVLASTVTRRDAHYTGVDASPRLIGRARKRYGRLGVFWVGNAADLRRVVRGERFDAVTFLLSLQNMNPLDQILSEASDVLVPGGRIAMLMTHPCFRPPRQSGWGFDRGRSLVYRRVDRYLTAFEHQDRLREGGRTQRFHHPLSDYVNALGAAGMGVERMEEIAADRVKGERVGKADRKAHREFPLFVGIRARKGD